jgi:Tfp pilus assembly protein PilF
MSVSDRLDGWKSIATHFGRDRTTVLRWAKERNLPVKKIPGGKRATVYALKSELDLWTLDLEKLSSASGKVEQPRRSLTRSAGAMLIALLLIAVTVGGVFFFLQFREMRSEQAKALPADKAVAALYLKARARWATRSSEEIELAISDLKNVVSRDPDFAEGHAALADAYLLAREYGALRDQDTIPAAKAAVAKAIKLSPNSAAAHRALGFIEYWNDHDPLAAQKSFEKALALSPDEPQTLLWYGNVLSDNGAHELALTYLARARAINAPSAEIETFYGWALWAAGRENEAFKILLAASEKYLGFAGIHDCLGVAYLTEGNFTGYADSIARRAALRHNLALNAYSLSVSDRVRAGDVNGLRDAIYLYGIQHAKAPGGENHLWSAYNASLAGNKARLIHAIDQGELLKENWGTAAYLDRIVAKWKGDLEIVGRIEQLRAPRIQ